MALTVGTNSYGSRAEADVYMSDSLNGDMWNTFTPTKKDQSLIEVTRILEREPWLGEKETEIQVLAFGRTGLTINGVSITAAESLAIMKTAQFEYAFAVLKDPKLLGTTNANGTNIKIVKAGSAKVEFFNAAKSGKLPTVVNDIVRDFKSSRSLRGGIVSGNCDISSFSEQHYDKNRGFN